MKEIIPTLLAWENAGKSYALATVIQTWGSSPRPVGSVMAISEDLDMAGSVSGGCVEGAVLREVPAVLQSGQPKLLSFGVTNDTAWSVGLTCGGRISVWLEPVAGPQTSDHQRSVNRELYKQLEENRSAILLSRLQEDGLQRTLVLPNKEQQGTPVDQEVVDAAVEAYRQRRSKTVETTAGEWFLRVFPRRSQLFVIGAAHIAVDLVHLAQYLDFETIVIDPRGIFADRTVFSTPPDQLIRQWPAEVLPNYQFDPYTYVVLLSHDPKIDDQALELLLRTDAAYIGALGSRRTHAKRVERLQGAGFSEAEIGRIHGPVGVDIHARTAREIALSIIAEIIKVKNEE